MTLDIAALNERFTLSGVAQIVAGNGGMPKIQITSPAASAEIYLHGAHLTSWHPTGADEVIFLSELSSWQPGKAIRGGVPICFPWFRDKSPDKSPDQASDIDTSQVVQPKPPAHGVVRTRDWQLESITQTGHSVIVTLAIESDPATRQWWPHDFRLLHRITIGSELKLELIVSNTGSTPFQFEEALHSYHQVGSIETISVSGLDGVAYLDNRDQNLRKLQAGNIRFTAPTDNAYIETTHSVEIVDPAMNRRIQIEKQNSLTTIVWTPWLQGAQSMADLGDEEWKQFACVEASNILAAAVNLPPGNEHIMAATIRVLSLP